MQYTYPCTKEEHLVFKDGKVSLPQRSLMEKYINFTSSESGVKNTTSLSFFFSPHSKSRTHSYHKPYPLVI